MPVGVGPLCAQEATRMNWWWDEDDDDGGGWWSDVDTLDRDIYDDEHDDDDEDDQGEWD